MARGCMFCGGGPLTKEHLWPNWMRKAAKVDERYRFRIEGEEDRRETRDRRFDAHP